MVLSTFGLLGCTQVTLSSIQASSSTQVTLQSSHLLGSISCLEGTQTAFLVQCTGLVSNPNAQGAVGIIGIPAGTALQPDVLEQARRVNQKRGKLLWQDGCFVFWQRGNTQGKNSISFALEESNDQQLATRNYIIYMVHTEGASNIIHAPTGIKLTIPQRSWPLDYNALQLRATGYGTKQVQDGVEWLLKGSIAAQATLPDDVFGFFLVRERKNPYKLMQKIIGSGEPWPIKPTLLNDCLIVPNSMRKKDHALEGHLLSNDLPLKEGSFSLFCYVKQGSGWYISQMEHVLPSMVHGRLSTVATPKPPTLALQGARYKVAPLQPEVCCASLSGRMQSVQWTNRTPENTLPADVQPCILFLRQGTIWRTMKLEALFAQLRTANYNVCVNEEHTLCLTTDESKTLDPNCFAFFDSSHDFQCFTCLFSKQEGKLKYYTEKQPVSLMHTALCAPLTIKLTGTASLSITSTPEVATKVQLSTPTVSLSDKQVRASGFLLAHRLVVETKYHAQNQACVLQYLKEGHSEALYKDGRLLYTVGAGNVQNCIATCYQEKLWTVANPLKDLAIVSWAQLQDGSIAFSNVVSVAVEEKTTPLPALPTQEPPLREGQEEAEDATDKLPTEMPPTTKKKRFGWF